MAVKKSSRRWPWWMILLWGYSILVSGFAVIIILVFPEPSSTTPTSQDALIGGIMFIPIVGFLVLAGLPNIRD